MTVPQRAALYLRVSTARQIAEYVMNAYDDEMKKFEKLISAMRI